MTISEFRTQFFDLVENSDHIVITAHISPDDDSIASVMAMCEILTTRYHDKDIQIVYGAEPTVRHQVFAQYKNIKFVSDLADHIQDTDLLIVLDVNMYARISKQPEKLQTIQKSIVIDHHSSAPDQFTLACIDKSYSSNSELIYRIFADEIVLTPSLAESILLGILGDTGNFAHISPAQSGVFILAKTLVETVGTSIDAFRSRYSGIPKRIIPLLQELVKNTAYISIEGWPDMQYSSITERGEYSDEDMSAASHIYMGQYLPRVEGYMWGLVATPRVDGSIRISGRSLPGSVNVRDLFERLGTGGGHDRAAGSYMKDIDVQDALQKIFDFMKNNKPVLG